MTCLTSLLNDNNTNDRVSHHRIGNELDLVNRNSISPESYLTDVSMDQRP